jgi:hypothetical protein
MLEGGSLTNTNKMLNSQNKQMNTLNDEKTQRSKKYERKQQDLNFKKWLLSLSSIGNLILGGLLVIMGVQ